MEIQEFCMMLSEFLNENLLDKCTENGYSDCDKCGCKNIYKTFIKTGQLCNEIYMKDIDVPKETSIKLYKYLKIEISKTGW